MLRKALGIIGLCCLLACPGCVSRDVTEPQDSPPTDPAREASIPVLPEMKVVPLSSRSAAKFGIDPNVVKGDILNVFYAENDTVLIDAEKLYLYDCSAGKIQAEAPRESFNQPRYQPCGSGFAAIGNLQSSLQGKVIFYSSSLKKESELTFSQIAGSDEPIFDNNIAVSPDGKKIAACLMDGITIYDTGTGARSKILDLTDGTSEIMHVGQGLFSADGKSLNLLLGVTNGGGESVPACGKINVDGTGLAVQRTQGFTPYEIVGSYGSFALFGEDDRYRSGRVAYLDTAAGTVRFLPLATKQERAAFGSDKGKYYATSELSGSGCTVRIYETDTGKKVLEQMIPSGGNALYVARNPVIRVLDESKCVFILMGNRQNDIKTIVTCFQL